MGCEPVVVGISRLPDGLTCPRSDAVLTLMDAPSPGEEKQPVRGGEGGGGAHGTCLDIEGGAELL